MRGMAYHGRMETRESDDISRELEAFLARGAGDALVVERTLKESPAEVTQLVRRVAGEGAGTLAVRKLIDPASGIGGAYEVLARAQEGGARLTHVPRVLECARQEGRLAVVMEYVPGQTLRERVAATPAAGRLAQAEEVFPQLCAAVSELHELPGGPVVHRDVTPSNVVVQQGEGAPRAWLVDLGIARTWRPGAGEDTTHFGTRAYAPPEQYGFGQTDVRSDVYALGLVLFFLLVGRDPAPADRERAFAARGVPEALRAVVARAAALDPAARYPSARALAGAFASAVASLPAPARPLRPAPTATRDVAPTPTSARRSLPARVLSRVPRAVGVVWNVAVTLAFGFVAFGCVGAAVFPSGTMAAAPMWVNFVVYVLYMAPGVLTAGFLLLDKRGLWRRFPSLAGHPDARDTVIVVLALAAGFVLAVLLVATFVPTAASA